MSEYRDGLPDDETRARYDAAIKAAAKIIATARLERDRLAAAEGSLALGRAVWRPGHPLGSPEAIAARYDELAARQRAGRDEGNPGGPRR